MVQYGDLTVYFSRIGDRHLRYPRLTLNSGLLVPGKLRSNMIGPNSSNIPIFWNNILRVTQLLHLAPLRYGTGHATTRVLDVVQRSCELDADPAAADASPGVRFAHEHTQLQSPF